jgi:hypothetical protein
MEVQKVRVAEAHDSFLNPVTDEGMNFDEIMYHKIHDVLSVIKAYTRPHL